MMKTIFVQVAGPQELQQLMKWGAEGEDNFLDPSVVFYPSTMNLRATQGKDTVMYMPVQTAFVLESLAINPEARKHEITVALREMVISLRLIAQQRGIGEIYFLGTNDKTNEFAKAHGFEELPWRAYRMKTFDEELYGDIQTANVGGEAGRPQGREQDIQTATTRIVSGNR
jgi:hypothetical protein